MAKWNEQAAPNNNSKSSDMDWSFKEAEKTTQGKLHAEQLNNKKIENEIRAQSFKD